MGKIEYLNGKSDEFTFNASILYSRLLNTILEINTQITLMLFKGDGCESGIPLSKWMVNKDHAISTFHTRIYCIS